MFVFRADSQSELMFFDNYNDDLSTFELDLFLLKLKFFTRSKISELFSTKGEVSKFFSS